MHTRSWRASGGPGGAQLEEMGAALAHQLKNPLTAVKALVQLGLRNPAESPSHQRLAAIEREVARMLEILRGHLASRPSGSRAFAPPGPAALAGDLLRP